MEEKILALRASGKSYNEITRILGCSKALVCYYCGTDQKAKNIDRQRKNRKENCLLQKTEKFQGRKLKDKTEDYQRPRIRKNGKPRLGKRSLTFNWKDVVHKFGWETTCYLTGKKIDLRKPRTYHFDHIVPVIKGGDSTLSNLGIASKEANMAKSGLLLEEFLQLCKEVLEFNGYEVK